MFSHKATFLSILQLLAPSDLCELWKGGFYSLHAIISRETRKKFWVHVSFPLLDALCLSLLLVYRL